MQSSERWDSRVALIRFGFDADLQKQVRGLPGIAWSQIKRSWYVPDPPGLYEDLKKELGMRYIQEDLYACECELPPEDRVTI